MASKGNRKDIQTFGRPLLKKSFLEELESKGEPLGTYSPAQYGLVKVGVAAPNGDWRPKIVRGVAVNLQKSVV